MKKMFRVLMFFPALLLTGALPLSAQDDSKVSEIPSWETLRIVNTPGGSATISW
jgi:hypothetical protein